mgnify:CR=1 FL=1
MACAYRKAYRYRLAKARADADGQRPHRDCLGPARAVLVDGVLFASIAEAGRSLDWATASGLGQAIRMGRPYKGRRVEFAPEPEWQPIWKEA